MIFGCRSTRTIIFLLSLSKSNQSSNNYNNIEELADSEQDLSELINLILFLLVLFWLNIQTNYPYKATKMEITNCDQESIGGVQQCHTCTNNVVLIKSVEKFL